MRHIHTAAVLFFLVLLWGCSTAPRVEKRLPDITPSTINDLNQWQLEGKLGIRYRGKNDSVYIQWAQDFSNYTIDLSGMLGVGATNIEGNNDYATIQQPGSPPVTHASPSELIESYTGWPLPIRQFRFWIKGQPAPDTPFSAPTLNNAGQLETFEQSGWTIEYARFNSESGLNLPEKIILAGQDIRITLVIKSWHLNSNNTAAKHSNT